MSPHERADLECAGLGTGARRNGPPQRSRAGAIAPAKAAARRPASWSPRARRLGRPLWIQAVVAVRAIDQPAPTRISAAASVPAEVALACKQAAAAITASAASA